MTTTAVKIGLIAVLAGAGLSFGRSENRQTVDLDEFPTSRLLRDLQDELEDIFFDAHYGHQDMGLDYANQEVPAYVLHKEIMDALGDEGDLDDDGYFADEEWDEDGDVWSERDDEDEFWWDEGELDLGEWEGDEDWNGEEISLADLEAEMWEAGTTLEEVVWEILMAAADEVAAGSDGPRILAAGFGLSAQGAAERNRRTPVGRAVRSAPPTLADRIERSR